MTLTGKKIISSRILLLKSEGRSNMYNLGEDGNIMVVYVLMRMGSV